MWLEGSTEGVRVVSNRTMEQKRKECFALVVSLSRAKRFWNLTSVLRKNFG